MVYIRENDSDRNSIYSVGDWQRLCCQHQLNKWRLTLPVLRLTWYKTISVLIYGGSRYCLILILHTSGMLNNNEVSSTQWLLAFPCWVVVVSSDSSWLLLLIMTAQNCDIKQRSLVSNQSGRNIFIKNLSQQQEAKLGANPVFFIANWSIVCMQQLSGLQIL